MPIPSALNKPLPLLTIATQFWDLNVIPRARAFKVLSYNCDDELEKDRLLEFASFEGQQELISYANRPRKTILEVLEDFPNATANLTLDFLFELFRPIKLRPFSIASSMVSNRLDLLVAVVEYRTRMATPRRGLCSNWLKTLVTGDRVRISIRNGTFKFPKSIDIPYIMVGPGTGLAIFRGMIQENETREMVLFFGCRNEEKDFHCGNELRTFEGDGKLKLFCAFSRDQNDKM